MTLLIKLAGRIDRLTFLLGQIATASVLGLIALVFYNVIIRYLGGGSPIWLQELEWHIMAPAMLVGIVVLMREGGHVRVDMLYVRFSARMQHLFDFISMLIGTMISLLLIKYCQGFLESSWSVFEASPDPGGLSGRYILKASLPIAFAFLALQCFANAIRHLNDFLSSTQKETAKESEDE